MVVFLTPGLIALVLVFVLVRKKEVALAQKVTTHMQIGMPTILAHVIAVVLVIPRELLDKMKTILLTKTCNLDCSYCYEKKSDKNFKTKKLKKELIGILYNTSSFSKRCYIEFLGGEPLLVFNKIKKLFKVIDHFEYVTKKKITVVISTNGLLLDLEKILFFKSKCSEIFVSLDGHFESNFDRFKEKKIFDLILKNIDNALKNNLKTNIHAVITHNNLDNLIENFIFLNSIGVNKIDFGIVVGADKIFFEKFKIKIRDFFDFLMTQKFTNFDCFFLKRDFFDSPTCYSDLCYIYAYELSLKYHFI